MKTDKTNAVTANAFLLFLTECFGSSINIIAYETLLMMLNVGQSGLQCCMVLGDVAG